MVYLASLTRILGFTLLGELLHLLVPLPVPAAIYGIVLLFGALCAGLVKPEQVKPSGDFLISVMPILFVAPAVNLMDSWQAAAEDIVPILVILAVSTPAVFGVSGLVTGLLLKKEDADHD